MGALVKAQDAGIHSASNTLQKSMQRSSSKRSSTADSPCSASSASPPKHLTPTLASFSSSVFLSLHPSSLPRRASTSQRASRCPPLLPLRHLSLPVSASPVRRHCRGVRLVQGRLFPLALAQCLDWPVLETWP